jgi:hypothetical protein
MSFSSHEDYFIQRAPGIYPPVTGNAALLEDLAP